MAILQSILLADIDGMRQAAQNNPPLARGARGDAVRALQLALDALGHSLPRSVRRSPISADGIFGAETDAAVRDFQRRNSLVADGIAGTNTVAALDRQLTVTRRDPLYRAMTDVEQLAYRMGKAVINGQQPSADAQALSHCLADLNGLALGNPARVLVRVKQMTEGGVLKPRA